MTPPNLPVPKHREIERNVAEHKELIVDTAWTGGLVVGGLVLSFVGAVWAGVPAVLAGAVHGWYNWRERRHS